MRQPTTTMLAGRRKEHRAHPRQKYLAGRAFYLTFLFMSVLATWALVSPRTLSDSNNSSKRSNVRRDGGFTGTHFENGIVVINRNEEVMPRLYMR